jgi:hypothetical protein
MYDLEKNKAHYKPEAASGVTSLSNANTEAFVLRQLVLNPDITH